LFSTEVTATRPGIFLLDRAEMCRNLEMSMLVVLQTLAGVLGQQGEDQAGETQEACYLHKQ
jgi:hypothetical protein